MSLRNIEQIPAPVHRGMTQLDRGAFVTQFSRLSVKVKNRDVGKVTKAKEMQPWVHRCAYKGRRLSAEQFSCDAHEPGISLASQDCGRSSPTRNHPISGSYSCGTKKKARPPDSTSLSAKEAKSWRVWSYLHSAQLPDPFKTFITPFAHGYQKYSATLDYDHWNAGEILDAVLPEELMEESPTSYTQTGHIGEIPASW
jgi:hypothetical protein